MESGYVSVLELCIKNCFKMIMLSRMGGIKEMICLYLLVFRNAKVGMDQIT